MDDVLRCSNGFSFCLSIGNNRLVMAILLAFNSLLLLSCQAQKDENYSLNTKDISFNNSLGSKGAQVSVADSGHYVIKLSSAPDHENWPNMAQFTIYNATGSSPVVEVLFDNENTRYNFNDYFYSWSYDQVHWNPIHWENGPEHSKNRDRLIFPKFERDTVFVGHQVPFSYPVMEKHISSWARHPSVTIKVIGHSTHGKKIYRVSIQGKDLNNDPWVHYFANQHPGEHNAQWRMTGMINYLLQEDNKYRKKSINHFVLMASPDSPENGWYRVNAEGVDMNRGYLTEGADSSLQSHETYLLQKDFESLMNSEFSPHTAWAMHTWEGKVEIWMVPGSEVGIEVGEWDVFRKILLENDSYNLFDTLQNRASQNKGSWGNGPYKQFGVTTFLCEGGGNLYTKEKNVQSGKILMQSIEEYYD